MTTPVEAEHQPPVPEVPAARTATTSPSDRNAAPPSSDIAAKWRSVQKSERSILWRRARLLVVGEGLAGKTALVRALRNLPFKHTDSTAGVSTSTLDTTDILNWADMDGTAYEQALSRIVAKLVLAQDELQKVLDAKPDDEAALREALKKATDAGLQSSTSRVVREVQKHLRQTFGTVASSLPEATADPSPTTKQKATTVKPVADHQPAPKPASTPESKTESAQPGLMAIAQQRFAQGKNSLVMRFADGKSDITLIIWDFGGQDVFHAMHSLLTHPLGIYAVVFDIRKLLDPATREQVIQFIAHWLNTIAMKAPEAPFILVGTHKDELSDEHAALNHTHQALTDLLTGMVNSDIVKRIHRPSTGHWFFGVDNKSRENTAAGKVRCKDPAIGEVRAALEHIVMNDKRTTRGLDGKKTLYINFPMPTRALMVLDAVKSGTIDAAHGGSDTIRSVRTFEDFQGAAKSVGLDSSPEAIRYLLGIFDGLGAVKWFPQVDESLVVVRPQWLLELMSSIIREHAGEHSQLLHYLNQDKDAIPLFKEADVKQGVFTATLLDYIWSSSKPEYNALNARPEEIEALKRIFESFGLICRVRRQRGTSNVFEECFVVPALLANPPPGSHPDARIRNLLTDFPEAQECVCRWDFSKGKWLPEYLFERLVCTIVTSCSAVQLREVVLSRGMADICAGDLVLLLCLQRESWCIEARTVNDPEVCPHASRWMLTLVQAALDKILDGIPNSGEAYQVLLSTDKGDVELPELCRAQKRVYTTARRAVPAPSLKAMWLDASDDCQADCCSAVAQPNVPILSATPTPKPAPTSTMLKAPLLDAQQDLAIGTKVKVHGIPHASMAHFNGKLGKIKSFQVLAKGYKVTFNNDSSQTLPRANLQAQTASALTPATAPAAGGGATHGFDNITRCEVGVVAGGNNTWIRYTGDQITHTGTTVNVNNYYFGDAHGSSVQTGSA